MARVFLIHWNASEAAERAERLRALGHEVAGEHASGEAGLRGIDSAPPDAVVIDLSRLPSHGRHTAVALRERKRTRAIPLVFVDGDPDKVERVREALPDATYTTWARIDGAIARAIESPPAQPVVPRRDSGPSGTPLPVKLGVKAGATLALLGAPEGFAATLEPLPDGVEVKGRAAGADVIVLFAGRRAELQRKLPAALRALRPGGALWLAWPKKASGVASDLSDGAVRELGLATGLVDTKVCALDATWAGLRFQRRRAGG